MIIRLGIASLLVAVLVLPIVAFGQDAPRVLKCGWYPWDPYQYLLVKQDVKRLTGLDVQLLRAVFAEMGYEVSYDEVGWKQHQLDVKNGVRDIAAGAFKNPERGEYAYFSAPYRKETDVLYVRKGEASRYRFKNVGELLQRFQEQSFRLGVISGFYYGPNVMQFISNPANAARIVTVPDDIANFENLLSRKIDGFVVDRLVGATLAWRHGWQLATEEVSPPVYSEDIHVLFSKKTTTPEMVEAFNRSWTNSNATDNTPASSESISSLSCWRRRSRSGGFSLSTLSAPLPLRSPGFFWPVRDTTACSARLSSRRYQRWAEG